MILVKRMQEYLCLTGTSVADALKKINKNKSRIIFVVNEEGRLLGSLSDGDVRRWLLGSDSPDLTLEIKYVMNESVRSLRIGTDRQKIKENFMNGIDCIPMIDECNHLVQLAFNERGGFFVGNK